MDLLQMESSFRDGAISTSISSFRIESPQASPARPIVFLVDADKTASASLAELLTREGWRVETFFSGEEFLANSVELAPACMVLDVALPGLSGLELQKRAALQCPHIPTIFLSDKGDIPTTVEAMKAGAVGFLTKPFRESELLGAVREALERSRMVVARKAEKQSMQRCFASLSLRQRQVMTLAASGMINKQIAAELGISEVTVKAHRGQVMLKMQANSFADLVKMAGRLGLAKSRAATTVNNHAGQITGRYAFVV